MKKTLYLTLLFVSGLSYASSAISPYGEFRVLKSLRATFTDDAPFSFQASGVGLSAGVSRNFSKYDLGADLNLRLLKVNYSIDAETRDGYLTDVSIGGWASTAFKSMFTLTFRLGLIPFSKLDAAGVLNYEFNSKPQVRATRVIYSQGLGMQAGAEISREPKKISPIVSWTFGGGVLYDNLLWTKRDDQVEYSDSSSAAADSTPAWSGKAQLQMVSMTLFLSILE